MNRKHRDRIDSCCEDMVRKTDLTRLWPKLLESGIFNRDDVNIPRWTNDLTKVETIRDVYMTIKTRGPFAFERLLVCLRQTDHETVADMLEGKSISTPPNETRIGISEASKKDVDAHGTEIISPDTKKNRDDFFHTLQLTEEPLQIVVRKATKFLDGPAYENVQRYPMRSYPRGLVLIITNIHYTYMKTRTSAKHDEVNLTQLFEQMGFLVIKFRDLTGQELADNVKRFSQREDLRRVDSCFIVISSHGSMEERYDDTEIQGVDYLERESHNYKAIFCTDIMDCFTAEACPHLAGKPKVFIFQMCRGERKQKSVKEPRHTTDTCNFRATKSDEINSSKTSNKKTTRNYADMIVVHATMPGHVAFRDNITGSWFIQILCEVFMNYACSTHLQDLLNIVDERLEIQRTTNEECQTLMVTSMGFNKHCYLNPGLFEKT